MNVLRVLDERLSDILVIQHWPRARPVLRVVEYACNGFPWLAASTLSSVVAYSYKWNQNTQHSLLILNFGLLLDVTVVGILKIYVQRPRPQQNIDDQAFEAPIADRYSFPSGHAARAAMLATLLCSLTPTPRMVGIVVASFVGWTRVALARHHLSDAFGGLLIGFMEGLLVLTTPLAVNNWMRRLFA